MSAAAARARARPGAAWGRITRTRIVTPDVLGDAVVQEQRGFRLRSGGWAILDAVEAVVAPVCVAEGAHGDHGGVVVGRVLLVAHAKCVQRERGSEGGREVAQVSATRARASTRRRRHRHRALALKSSARALLLLRHNSWPSLYRKATHAAERASTPRARTHTKLFRRQDQSSPARSVPRPHQHAPRRARSRGRTGARRCSRRQYRPGTIPSTSISSGASAADGSGNGDLGGTSAVGGAAAALFARPRCCRVSSSGNSSNSSSSFELG